MCLSKADAKLLDKILESFRRGTLNGDVPDTDVLAEAACKRMALKPERIPSKTSNARVIALFKAIQTHLPSIFDSDNDRNKAAKRAARLKAVSGLDKLSVNDLKKELEKALRE